MYVNWLSSDQFQNLTAQIWYTKVVHIFLGKSNPIMKYIILFVWGLLVYVATCIVINMCHFPHMYVYLFITDSIIDKLVKQHGKV